MSVGRVPREQRGDVGAGQAAALALVESPLQLVMAVEAADAGLLGTSGVRLRVRAGVPGLDEAASRLAELDLPPGIVIERDARRLAPATSARRVLAVGDAGSGRVQAALVQTALVAGPRPKRVVLVDDGLATWHVVRALVGADDATLVRIGVDASAGRRALAGAARRRLLALAARGRLTVFTALDLPPDVRAALGATGARVVRNELRWLARQRPTDRITEPVVVVGSAMVADGLVRAAPYVEWVRGHASRDSVRYVPHRRQTTDVLEALGAIPGVVVDRAGLPVELRLAGLRAPQRVVALPTTALALLPGVLAGSGVLFDATVPGDDWWLPGVARELREHLVRVVER